MLKVTPLSGTGPPAQVRVWALAFAQQHPSIEVSEDTFLRWFDWMGMQRHLKAVGIFARLNWRDSKPNYLNDIPRTLNYLVACAQAYPETEAFAQWLQSITEVSR